MSALPGANVRFSQRYRAYVIVDSDGLQAFDYDGRPLVFINERAAHQYDGPIEYRNQRRHSATSRDES